MIRLNVGGRLFEVFYSTLQQFEDSLFSGFFFFSFLFFSFPFLSFLPSITIFFFFSKKFSGEIDNQITLVNTFLIEIQTYLKLSSISVVLELCSNLITSRFFSFFFFSFLFFFFFSSLFSSLFLIFNKSF